MSSITVSSPKDSVAQKFDSQVLRNTLGTFATGVTIVSFEAKGKPAGMTANAFMSVSLDPALIVISVRDKSKLNEFVRMGDTYGVSVLNSNQEYISNHFGGRPDSDLNIDFDYVQGTPLIKGSQSHFVARTIDIHRAGDHFLLIGEIEYLSSSQEEKDPLLFYGGKYRKILG